MSGWLQYGSFDPAGRDFGESKLYNHISDYFDNRPESTTNLRKRLRVFNWMSRTRDNDMAMYGGSYGSYNWLKVIVILQDVTNVYKKGELIR